MLLLFRSVEVNRRLPKGRPNGVFHILMAMIIAIALMIFTARRGIRIADIVDIVRDMLVAENASAGVRDVRRRHRCEEAVRGGRNGFG